MFIADYLYVNQVLRSDVLLSIMLTKDKKLTTNLTSARFLTLNYASRKKDGPTNKTVKTKTKKIRIMKKTIIAAVAALFIGFGANAQSVNDNNEANATVADVVAELSQADALQFIAMYQKMLTEIESVCRTEDNDEQKTAKIDDIKEIYTDMFSEILVTAQNEVAINSIPMDYINNRVAK